MPDHKQHELACLIGPNGEIRFSTFAPDKYDLETASFNWSCEILDIRRATLRVTVPVLGAPPAVGLVGEVEVEGE